MVNVNCTGGGGYFSDDMTATKANVVAGYRTITKDSNDEIVEGTMGEIDANDVQASNNIANNNLYLRMSNGAHRTSNQTSGYPEVSIPLSDLRQTIGFNDAGTVLQGTTIAGTAGTMPNIGKHNETLGLTGYVLIPKGYHDGSGVISRSYSVNTGGVYTPSAKDQTISTSGKIVTGNINCAGDSKLIASNIKHGVSIFGVTGDYVSPSIYSGGDATALFGQKSFTYGYISGDNDYRPNYSHFGSFNTVTMTTEMLFDCALSTCYGGGVWLVANKLFDISKFNSLTVNYNVQENLNGNNGYNGAFVQVGLTSTGGRYTDDPSDNYYCRLGGVIDSKTEQTSKTANNQTVTLSLTYAKTKGSQFYPYIMTKFKRGDGGADHPYVYVKINSIYFQ